MSRNLFMRQNAVDLQSPSKSQPISKKLRKTDELVFLDFSTVDEPKSKKSTKYTSKTTNASSKIVQKPINSVLVGRKILRARRYAKEHDNNNKSTIVQHNFNKIHGLFDKVADKYFDFELENENKENTTINNTTLNSIEEHDKSIEKSHKKQASRLCNVKSTITEKLSNSVINNKKEYNTVHITQPRKSDTSKKRRTVGDSNEALSMDKQNDSEMKPAKKRRTYELEITVTNIEDLKNLEQSSRKSKSRSGSFLFEDVQLEEELKPSTDDCRDVAIPPQSLIKETFSNKSTVDNSVLIDVCKSTTENEFNSNSKHDISVKTDHCKSASLVFMDEDDEVPTSYQPKSPINKRLNFSNITLRQSKNNSKIEDSIIIIDDSSLLEDKTETANNCTQPSTSKVSTFKTPFKKIAELQRSFISSTPGTFGSSQKKASTQKHSATKSNSKQSRVKKMPNFTLLHQKAFSEMEDIVEYEKRKTERAKLLLSGQKPSSVDSISDNNNKLPASKQIKNKRFVKFAPGCEEKEKPANYIPLPTTPFPKYLKNFNIEDTPSPPSSSSSTTTTTTKEMKLKQATPGPSKETAKTKVNLNPFSIRPGIAKPTVPVNGNLNRFGFKIVELPKTTTTSTAAAAAAIARKEVIKAAIVNKTKFNKKGTEERRNAIKGVRSNRRFDLLMKLRNANN